MIKFRFNFLLILITGLLFSYIYFVDMKTKSTDVIKETILDIWNIDILNIKEIILKNKNETILLKKQGEEWYIKSPIDFKAEMSILEPILNSNYELKAERIIETISNKNSLEKLNQYGLNNPAYTLILKQDKNSYTLFIGNKALINENYFAKIKGDNRIFFINNQYVDNINKNVNDLKFKEVFPKKLIEQEFSNIEFYKNKNLIFKADFDEKKWKLYKKNSKSKTIGNNFFNIFIETIKTTNIEEILNDEEKNNIFNNKKIYKLCLFNEKEKEPIIIELAIDKEIIYGYQDNKILKLDNRMISLLDKDFVYFTKEEK